MGFNPLIGGACRAAEDGRFFTIPELMWFQSPHRRGMPRGTGSAQAR